MFLILGKLIFQMENDVIIKNLPTIKNLITDCSEEKIIYHVDLIESEIKNLASQNTEKPDTNILNLNSLIDSGERYIFLSQLIGPPKKIWEVPKRDGSKAVIGKWTEYDPDDVFDNMTERYCQEYNGDSTLAFRLAEEIVQKREQTKQKVNRIQNSIILKSTTKEDKNILINSKSEIVSLQEIFQEMRSRFNLEKTFVATDLDKTAFKQDFGKTFFIELMMNSNFYLKTPEEFGEILLNFQTRSYMESRLKEDNKEFLNYLYDRIMGLYKKLYKQSHCINLSNSLREFIMYMFEIDNFMKNFRRDEIEEINIGNFMRTRFFTGIKEKDVDDIAYKQAKKNKICYLRSNLGSDCVAIDSMGIESIPQMENIYRMVYEEGSKVFVITANVSAVAKSAIKYSSISHIVKPDQIRSTIQMENEKKEFMTEINGARLKGRKKEEMVQKIISETKRNLLLVCGDNLESDGYMGIKALKDGAYFIMPTKNYSHSIFSFEKFLNRQQNNCNVDNLFFAF